MTRFQDPPGPGRTGAPIKYVQLAADLRARPGEWAVFAEDTARSTVSNITQAKLAAFQPAGSFEATGRNLGHIEGRCKVWVRFIG